MRRRLRETRGRWGVMKALLVVAMATMACAAPATPAPIAVPTWPVPAEMLPAPTATAITTATCGGRSFPVEGLDAPTGAELATGPEYDALRAAIERFGSEFPGSSTWTWRRAGIDALGAVFLATTDDLGAPGRMSIDVEVVDGTWQPAGMGQCQPRAVLSAEFGPATWALDPDFPSPTASSTELHILVWEVSCSGGAPATGRMSAPVIAVTPESVAIAIGVRALEAAPGTAFGCPMPPGTPAIIRLTEPLGERTLLDAGRLPPAPPIPAGG